MVRSLAISSIGRHYFNQVTAMLRSHRPVLVFAALATLATIGAFSSGGPPRPLATLDLLEIAGEAGIALLTGALLVFALASRAPGRSGTLLACGLSGLMLGATADCMDEFFVLAAGNSWLHLLESGTTLTGMAALAWGLIEWRREQFSARRRQEGRERLFRDHRSYDGLTQVGDADYLREQLRIEFERGRRDCCLLMIDIDSFHLVNRDFGQREGDRVLQAVAQILMLNLRSSDLLCRYAGDRFAILLPATHAETAHALADHLRRAVACLRHHAQRSGLPITPTVRYVFRNVDAEPRQLLKELNRALERRMPSFADSALPLPAVAARA